LRLRWLCASWWLRYLHHALPRPHTQPCTHTTPLYTTTLQHPTCSPPRHLHLITISILAINSLSQGRRWDPSQQPLRIARPSTSTQNTQFGVILKNYVWHYRPLLGFAAKVRLTNKFWKQDCYMNTLFKFVRVLQVKDWLNACALFILMDSSRFQRGFFDFKHNPQKSGGVPCVPFWNDVCCCKDTHHFRALDVPPSRASPHQQTFVCGACAGTAQVGVSLVSLFNPLFKQSWLHCLDVYFTWYLWQIQVWWWYTDSVDTGMLTYLTAWCTTHCTFFAKNMMVMYQQFPRIRYVSPYGLVLVLICGWEIAFSIYQIVRGLFPPPFPHPDSLECWCLGN